MDYQEIQSNLNILEAHAVELYELLFMLADYPLIRGQIIESLLSCNDRITGLKKQLQK